MTPSAKTVVLDASALLAWLLVEPGHAEVRRTLLAARKNECRAFLNLVTLGEIVYRIEQRHGAIASQRFLKGVDGLGLVLHGVSRDLAVSAGRFKLETGIPYVDAYVAATARALGGAILTADPDFRKVENRVLIQWIR
ncbi:MAG: PIN domain-containing protein [Planctomycetes bacterium]|nr:PIN domain-containing protein [Planctomycetota bacterium]